MPVGDCCPVCGGKLNPKQAHLVWRLAHTPVTDWICWNAAARMALPALAVVAVLALLLELLAGGLVGVENLLLGALPGQLLLALLVLCAAVLLGLYLQGEDELCCSLDSRGVTVQVYLPRPTPLRLLLRGKHPRLMREHPGEPLLVAEHTLPWKRVNRVQLWPGKPLVLLYAPRWWLRLALPCPPERWEEALGALRTALGSSKQVQLPPALRTPSPAGGKARAGAPRADQHPAPFMDKRDG